MPHTWNLRKGKVHVVEDDSTASLVIVANGLSDLDDKIAVLEEVLLELRAREVDCVTPALRTPTCEARKTERHLSR
jgi:hypothetical protein